MNEQQIIDKLNSIEVKLRNIERVTKRTQKQFLWFIILTLASFALPVLGLIFLIPKFVSIYSGLAI